MKRVKMSLMIMVMFLCMSYPVLAHDVPDMDKEGTIIVDMKMGEEVIKGGSLTLYQVGNVHEDDGNYSFVLNETFKDSGATLDDITSKELAQTLSDYAKKINAVADQTVNNTEGVVKFENVKAGLYLIVQHTAAPGYEKAPSFLVSLPYMIEGKYEYEVNASPKISFEKAPETTPPTPPGIPETGVLNWPVPVMAVGGIALVAMGWLLMKKDEE